MSETATIGAVFPSQHTLAKVAFEHDLIGVTPGGCLRYLAFLAAGIPRDEARARVMPQQNLKAFADRRSNREQTVIPKDAYEAIKQRYPGRSISWVLRYHAAMELTGNAELAEELASSVNEHHGRSKGSKDSYQRTRRTKAELSETTA